MIRNIIFLLLIFCSLSRCRKENDDNPGEGGNRQGNGGPPGRGNGGPPGRGNGEPPGQGPHPQQHESPPQEEEEEKASCFDNPNEELKQKLKACIKENKKMFKEKFPMFAALPWSMPPRIFFIKTCYFAKLGIVNADFTEFSVENLGKSLLMYDGNPDEVKNKLEDVTKKCEDAAEIELPENLKEMLDKAFPKACRKAAGVFQCIKMEIAKICDDFSKQPGKPNYGQHGGRNDDHKGGGHQGDGRQGGGHEGGDHQGGGPGRRGGKEDRD